MRSLLAELRLLALEVHHQPTLVTRVDGPGYAEGTQSLETDKTTIWPIESHCAHARCTRITHILVSQLLFYQFYQVVLEREFLTMTLSFGCLLIRVAFVVAQTIASAPP